MASLAIVLEWEAMVNLVNFEHLLPEIPENNFRELYFQAAKKVADTKHIDEKYPDLPPGIGKHFIQVYPEKCIEDDESLLIALTGLVRSLEGHKSQPVLLVNDHISSLTGEAWQVITYGFSGGGEIALRANTGVVVSGEVRLKLCAAQSISYFGDKGVSAATSFAVDNWGLGLVPHIGSYLLNREPSYSTFREGKEEFGVVDSFGQIAVGNSEIEFFQANNPQLTEVVDGCRDAYRNGGLHPMFRGVYI